MANEPLETVLHQFRQLVMAPAAAKLSDRELLERFVRQQDGAAFAALVKRYGGLVLGVCRRVLHRVHDAEDACQAAFLVLARKAASIRKKESLGSWLHGVAYRVAQRLKRDLARQRARERPVVDVPQADATADVTWREVRAVVDEEVRRLPHKYQAPVVLCYLQGMTRDEAAQQLGWSEGTLRGRLQRGRELLRARLTRRGLALSAALLPAALAQDAVSAALSATHVVLIVKAASLVAVGRSPAAGVVSARVATLTEGVLRAMFMTKVKIATGLLLALSVVGGGVGTHVYRTASAQEGALKLGNKNQPAATAIGHAEPATDRQERRALQGPAGVRAVAFSPDGKVLAAGHTDGMVTLWDMRTAKKVATLPRYRRDAAKAAVLSVAFSPDGKRLASGCSDERGMLWDVAIGKVLVVFTGVGHSLAGIAFSPDGKTLASGCPGQQLRLWDAATGRRRGGWSQAGEVVAGGAVAFAPDRKTLATASADGTVRLLDVASGKEVRRLLATGLGRASNPALVLAFSPDGKLLASSGSHKSVTLWDVAAGKQLRTFLASSRHVLGVAFSPDGRLLAVGGGEKVVRLFDLATGEQVIALTGHQDAVSSVAFSPDGRILASGSNDGTMRLWRTGTDNLERLVQYLVQSNKADEASIEALFLATLGRFPTETEKKFSTESLTQKKDRKDALENVLFTLVNTKEFRTHVESLSNRQPRLPP